MEGGSSLKFFELFLIPSFGCCGWREMRVFDGVETSIVRSKDKWLESLFFFKEEVFCSSMIDVIDFVNSLFWVEISFSGCFF